MAITVQSTTVTQAATATSVDASPPPSIADGELMLNIYALADGTATVPSHGNPAGWNDWPSASARVSGRFLLQAITKIAASESGNYTFTSDDTMDHIAAIMRITGAATYSHAHKVATTTTASQNTHTCPAVTTTVDNCLIIYIAQQATTTAFSGTPADTTLAYNNTLVGDTSQRLAIYWKMLPTAGDSGTGVFTTSVTKSCGLMTLAVAPPTTLYLPSTGASAVSPAFDSDWEETGAAIRRAVDVTAISSAMTTLTDSPDLSANREFLLYQGVSKPLTGAQTISAQTLKLAIRASEGNTGNNLYVAAAIYVVSGDGGTVRGTISDVNRDDTEVATTLTNRYYSISGSSVSAQDGDRIIIELGLKTTLGILSINNDGSLRIGDGGGSNLPFDDSSTSDLNPILEFQQALVFGAETITDVLFDPLGQSGFFGI